MRGLVVLLARLRVAPEALSCLLGVPSRADVAVIGQWAMRAWRAAAGGNEAHALPEPPPLPAFLPAWRGHTLLRPPEHAAPLCIQCSLTFRGPVRRACSARAPSLILCLDVVTCAPAWVRACAVAAGQRPLLPLGP